MSGGKLDFTEMEMDVDLDADVSISPISLTHSGTANLNATLKGSKNEPVAMMILGDKNAPASFDVNTGISTSIKGSQEEPVAMMVLGDQKRPVSTFMTGDKDRPISAAFELTNLPRFSVADIKEMLKPKMRLSFPGHRQLCFKLLGQELFSICYGGEGQMIIEPYKSRDWDCEVPVCDVDKRPFPNPKENPKEK